MDIGLVCDACDTFNAMNAQTCTACGGALSLGGARRPAPPKPAPVAGPPPVAAPPATPRPSGSGVAVVKPPTSARPAAQMCSACGTAIQPGFRFCGKCGAKVEGPAKPERKTMFFGAMQQARAKLTLIKGDGLDGVSFTLAGQDHIAGRVEGPLLFEDDPYLSPRHANFFYVDNRLVVHDEGSRNGIFLRIRAPMPMREGDIFLVGEQLLRVDLPSPEGAGVGPDDDGTYYYASPRPAMRLQLTQLLRGGEVGLVYSSLADTIVVGREEQDINFPDDPFISGRHAQVTFTDAGILLTDLGSKNGTFLRVRQDTPLNHGDYVFMGQQLLRVEIV